jgi:hypothetical protein
MVDASRQVATENRGSMQTDTRSTSCHRVPHGENISRGVFVPIMDGPAVTGPLANGKRHVSLQRAADRAHLARRKPAVDFDDSLAVHSGLSFNRPNGHADTGIAQAAGQAVVLDHAAQIQVFNTDRVESLDQVPGQFGGRVLARIGDLFMQFRYLLFLAAIPVRAFLFARQGLLLPLQSPLVAVHVFRISNALPVGQGGQSADAEIDTHRFARCRQGGGMYVQHHGDNVAAGWLADHGNGSRLTRDRPGPLDPQWAELGQQQPLGSDLEAKRRPGVFRRLFAVLAFEGGVAGALLKEVSKRRLEMAQRLLGRHAGGFVQPSRFRLPLQRGQRRAGLAVVHPLATLERLGALLQAPVVDVSDATERASKLLGLRIGRVATERPTLFHGLHFNIALCKP